MTDLGPDALHQPNGSGASREQRQLRQLGQIEFADHRFLAPQQEAPRLAQRHVGLQHADRRVADFQSPQGVRAVVAVGEHDLGAHLRHQRHAHRRAGEVLRLLRDQPAHQFLLAPGQRVVLDHPLERFHVEPALVEERRDPAPVHQPGELVHDDGSSGGTSAVVLGALAGDQISEVEAVDPGADFDDVLAVVEQPSHGAAGTVAFEPCAGAVLRIGVAKEFAHAAHAALLGWHLELPRNAAGEPRVLVVGQCPPPVQPDQPGVEAVEERAVARGVAARHQRRQPARLVPAQAAIGAPGRLDQQPVGLVLVDHQPDAVLAHDRLERGDGHAQKHRLAGPDAPDHQGMADILVVCDEVIGGQAVALETQRRGAPVPGARALREVIQRRHRGEVHRGNVAGPRLEDRGAGKLAVVRRLLRAVVPEGLFPDRHRAAQPRDALRRVGSIGVQIRQVARVDREREVVQPGRGLQRCRLVCRLLQTLDQIPGRVVRVHHLLADQPQRRDRAATRTEPEAVRHHQRIGRREQAIEHADARSCRVVVETDHRAIARDAGQVQVEGDRPEDNGAGIDRSTQRAAGVRDRRVDRRADELKCAADFGNRQRHSLHVGLYLAETEADGLILRQRGHDQVDHVLEPPPAPLVRLQRTHPSALW